jgi:hypothetical protein
METIGSLARSGPQTSDSLPATLRTPRRYPPQLSLSAAFSISS